MSAEIQLNKIKDLLTPLLEEDMFLVDMRIKPTNNVKIFIDADGGLPLEKCIKVNRALYKLLEESGIFPLDDYSLEVSSPGIDEPLKLHRQFKKNIGRDVQVSFPDDRTKAGKLIAVGENDFVIRYTEGKGKKAVEHTDQIRMDEVKQVKVLIKF